MDSENELKFEVLLATAPFAIVVVNPDGEIDRVNEATERLFGYASGELHGQPLEILIPQRYHKVHRHHRAEYHAEPHVRSMGAGLNLVGVKKDGSEFPLEIALSTVPANGTRQAIAFITDISARRDAEATQQRLRAELQEYAANLEEHVRERTREIEQRRSVAEGLRDILALLNSNLPFSETLSVLANLAHATLGAPAVLLFEQEHLKTLSVVAAVGIEEESAAAWRGTVGQGAVGQAIQRALPIAITDTALYTGNSAQLRLADGRAPRSFVIVPLFVNNAIFGALGLYYPAPHQFGESEIDLAVTFARQATLAIENARLRQEVATAAVAAERSRLARELHDAVTQILFAASITADVLPRLWERSPEAGMAKLQDLRQLTKSALAEMRTLLYELRPQVLAKTDMHTLFQQLGEALRGRAQIEVNVSVSIEGALPTEVHMAFYRIAQEATNNIAKHAQAQQAWLTLEMLPDDHRAYCLTIRDDGAGFLLHTKSATMLGLEIMNERADAIGAALTINSQPGEGTEIVVEWREARTHDNEF